MSSISFKNFYEQQGENFVAFFMSDLHLSASTKNEIEKLELFIEFLIKNKSKANLYFLGDTFDFWFGYASPSEKQTQILLKKILDYKKQSKAEVIFFEGNHDIHLAPYFKDMGFDVEPNRRIVNLNTKKIVLEHGDMFDPEDKGYLFLRRFLRSKFIRFMGVTVLPTYFVSWMGDFFSSLSAKKTRVENPERTKNVKSKFINYGFETLNSNQADVFIAGHTHQRLIETKNNKTVINLGTWCDGQPIICAQTSSSFEFLSI